MDRQTDFCIYFPKGRGEFIVIGFVCLFGYLCA